MARRVLILSDIDGTLVDHPFLSGSNLESRRSGVDRMFRLFAHPNFGLVTGRRKEGFERFFAEYDIAPVLPAFLAVEFATHHAVKGEWVLWRERNRHVQNLMQELQAVVGADAEFGRGHDVFQALRNGKIETYFLEEKTLCAQIEGHFPDAERQRRFFSVVEEMVNPRVTGSAELVLQGFPSMGRIDVMEKGFVPKAGFWPTIEAHREALELVPNNELTVVALGDELYDSYMFRYLRNEIGGKLSRVYAVSVGRSLAWATHCCSDTSQALALVENILENDVADDATFSHLEVI